MGFTWTGNPSEVGAPQVTPMYLSNEARSICQIGTFNLMIYCFVTFPQTTDKEFNPKIFKLFNGSSMWAYVSHPLWQNVIITLIYPYELPMWTLFFVVQAFTVVCVFWTYGPVHKMGLI